MGGDIGLVIFWKGITGVSERGQDEASAQEADLRVLRQTGQGARRK